MAGRAQVNLRTAASAKRIGRDDTLIDQLGLLAEFLFNRNLTP
jgi:hypothetical protein